MRQSLSTGLGETPSRATRGHRFAAVLTWGALAGAVLMLAVIVIDQTGTQGLYGFTEATYASSEVSPEPAVIYGVLYTMAITITLAWSLMLVALRARGWWPSILSAAAALVTGVLAVVLLTATEYDENVFAPAWGLIALIPTVLGIAATVQLARSARR